MSINVTVNDYFSKFNEHDLPIFYYFNIARKHRQKDIVCQSAYTCWEKKYHSLSSGFLLVQWHLIKLYLLNKENVLRGMWQFPIFSPLHPLPKKKKKSPNSQLNAELPSYYFLTHECLYTIYESMLHPCSRRVSWWSKSLSGHIGAADVYTTESSATWQRGAPHHLGELCAKCGADHRYLSAWQAAGLALQHAPLTAAV